MANLALKRMFKEMLRIQSRFYDDLMSGAVSRRGELRERFRKAEGDDEYTQFLEMEASDLNGFIQDVAEVGVVALHHWVERSMKAILRRCPGGGNTKKLDFGDLEKRFAKHQIKLAALPSYRIVNVARLVANSWKHEPRWASSGLLRELGLPAESDVPGLLGNEAVRHAVFGLVGPVDGQDEDLLFALRDRAVEFLYALVDASPIDFAREPLLPVCDEPGEAPAESV